MLLLRLRFEHPEDDVDWIRLTIPAEVLGSSTPPGFSALALEKEVTRWRSTWDCAIQLEARESDAQPKRHSLVVITSFVHFFGVH